MALFKNKDHSNKKAATAATFSSVIVIDGYTLRPVKKASTAFRYRTFFVSLFTNKVCSFSELYDAARFLSNSWRSIINKDCKYQQSLDNLPSFLGVRNICFKPLNNEQFEPYMVIEMDNIQAAAFIARCWCKRTGQLPREFSIAVADKRGDIDVIVEEFHKSAPLYIELLWERYKCNIVRLQFGAAVTIAPKNKEYEAHVIPVQGVRCSQSFGTEKNVHTKRKIKQLYENKAAGTLERIRRQSRSAAAIEYERAKKELIYSHITRSEYGAKEIFGIGSRYQRARDKYMFSEQGMLDTQLDAMRADGVPFAAVLNGHKLSDRDLRHAAALGIELPQGVITEEAAAKIVRHWEEQSKLKKTASVEDAADIDEAGADIDEAAAAAPLNPQQKRRIKEAALKAVADENTWKYAKVTPLDVEAVISTLKEVCEVSVEADGQISIKF